MQLIEDKDKDIQSKDDQMSDMQKQIE